MGGTGVIDRFLEVFTRYIDSGFGLLNGEVAFLATTLAAIDITLAAIFWSWAAEEDIIARLAKKTLFVGVFAYLIGNWNNLARIVFESFAGLGLKASGTGMSTADLLSPGRVAQVGIDAGRPILDSISGLMGYISFFENFVQIVVLLFAWIVVLLAFFILAIQLFVTLIEFKLTTLAGFVLIPFGLFGKTAFAAERVLGNVISSGVKVLVLAVIVGIGSTLFSQFTAGFGGNQPTIEDAMSMVLAALSLLGLGIFGPGIANGIVSGGPQLGAGAAVGKRPAHPAASTAAMIRHLRADARLWWGAMVTSWFWLVGAVTLSIVPVVVGAAGIEPVHVVSPVVEDPVAVKVTESALGIDTGSQSSSPAPTDPRSTNSTPVARVPENRIRVVCAEVTTFRFGRDMTGCR